MKQNIMRTAAAIVFSILVLALIPFGTALAANQLLVIDSSHLYEGMNKTYGQGYLPRVAGGEAQVYLPLVVSEVYGETIEGNEITVTPDLGDVQDSPFAEGDYSRKVQLKAYGVRDENNNQVTQNAYFVFIDLPLKAERVNGRYPVVFQISYLNNTGVSVQQSFTVYVGITDGIAPTAPPVETAPPAGALPRIIVSNYQVMPKTVQAGDSFTVDFTMQNTSQNQAVTDIVVSYSGETEDLIPSSNANTFFVSRIEKNSDQISHIKMNAQADAKTATYKVILLIRYSDENGSEFSIESDIPVEVKQPIRLKYDQPNIPDPVYAGDFISPTIKIYNMGKDVLYNVTVSMQAEGFISKEATYLGNIESGVTKTAEVSAQAPGDPGSVNGKLIVSYEDEKGERYSEEVPFTSEILHARAGLWGLPRQWSVFGWVAVAAAAALAAFLIRKLVLGLRKNKNKKH